jgi:hypothetical protein
LSGEVIRMISRKDIEKATAVLVNTALWNCNRAADMATFDFGRRTELAGAKGRMKIVGDYALHVQCAWRIAQENQIIVGSRDLYYPADYSENSTPPSDFDWDHSPNRRDKLMTALFANDRQFLVRSVNVGAAGRLDILLSDGFCLEILPDDSLLDEHWRLFEPGGHKPHFVLTGNGIKP